MGFPSDEDDRAIAAVDEALGLLREAGNDFGERRALQLLARLAQRRGDSARARDLMHDAVAKWRRAESEFGLATALHGLADVELDAGALEAARAAYEEALRAARRIEAGRLVAYCLGGLAAVAAAEGDDERAAALRIAVQALEQRFGFRLRLDRAERYGTLRSSQGGDGDGIVGEASLLEDATAYALGEVDEPAWRGS